MSTPKFCRDCKHVGIPVNGPGYVIQWWCKVSFIKPFTSIVTGETFEGISMDCHYARQTDGPCGPDANLFEPKEKE